MSKFWKSIAMTGGLLLALPGLPLAVNLFCIFPFVLISGGSEAVIYGVVSLVLTMLMLGGGVAVFRHADRSLKGKPSKPLRLPPLLAGLGAFALLMALGVVITKNGILPGLFFPPIFLALAALPPLWAVSWFTPHLSIPKPQPAEIAESAAPALEVSAPAEATENGLTWRRGLVAFCGGATVSVFLAILLEIVLPLLALVLIFTAADTVINSLNGLVKGLAGSNVAEALANPAFIYIFIQIAVIAPLVEELVKPLVTLPLLPRLNRQETFWVGAMAGAGFATLENVLYATGGFSLWAGIFVVRALGGALHPLGSGLVALGWREVLRGEPHALTKWIKNYAIAVLAHAAWNGGSLLVITLAGAQFFGKLPPEMDILGISMAGTTLAFLLILGIAGLWIGHAYGHDRPLSAALEGDPAEAGFVPSDRAMALWGLACLLALVPVGITGLRLWLR